MVYSSNDAGTVLAEHISGTVENFAVLMNQKAIDIGCTNTNFTNPSGVHDENHYSTAYDLALISNYAMNNQTFRKLVSTTSYALPATNKYELSDRYFTNSNELIIVNNNKREDNYYYKYATGIKTGFTTPAGYCLIASANKDGFELLTVVLGATQTTSGLSQRYIDTISLFDYGYKTYAMKKIISEGDIVQTVDIDNATNSTKKLDIIVSKDIKALVKSESMDSQLLPQITLYDNLKAPIVQYQEVGTISYVSEGITYEATIIANSEVKASHTFIKICIFILILLLAYIYLRNKNLKKKNRKKNYRISKNKKKNYRKK